MRQRDPNHEKRLNQLCSTSPQECKRQIGARKYTDADYVVSEVLASLVRLRFGKETGVLDVATAELHRRVIKTVEIRVWGLGKWYGLMRNDSEIVAEAAQYFWDIFLKDEQQVCNAEVRFAVYLNDRLDDFRRHLLTQKNSQKSVDDIGEVDDDGSEGAYIDAVGDPTAETLEEIAARVQKSKHLTSILVALPQKQRNAFYYRVAFGYDWKTVAELLKCSIPTARSYVASSIEQLQGALE
ncbi:MAG: sigma factor-like helix-turn-helix DNA-binding protein [Sulfuritalea sp.]|nr:sigma factor-like helix-turn-helix DNA-binding protein [Sulfuritalea sp.]